MDSESWASAMDCIRKFNNVRRLRSFIVDMKGYQREETHSIAEFADLDEIINMAKQKIKRLEENVFAYGDNFVDLTDG